MVTLVISDVPGDDPSIIASGPTIPDRSTTTDVLSILQRYDLTLPSSAMAHLLTEHVPFRSVATPDVRMIASPALALAAAEKVARQFGLAPLVLGDAIEGEAREVGKVMASMAQSVRRHGAPVRAPAVLLSGGETTVSFHNQAGGRGGRNTEFLLAMAVALQGEADIWALAADTDGIDGTEDAAGAVIAPDTLARGRAARSDARSHLNGHDSYSFFDATGDLIKTGPTLTNVNDFRAVLIS